MLDWLIKNLSGWRWYTLKNEKFSDFLSIEKNVDNSGKKGENFFAINDADENKDKNDENFFRLWFIKMILTKLLTSLIPVAIFILSEEEEMWFDSKSFLDDRNINSEHFRLLVDEDVYPFDFTFVFKGFDVESTKRSLQSRPTSLGGVVKFEK